MTSDISPQPLTHDEISELVRGIDPVDWVQMELLARISPADRVLAGMRTQRFAMAALRGTLIQRFPQLSLSQINMMVLQHFTPVRMGNHERD